MKDNSISSKNTRTVDSKPFIDQLKRNFRNCVGTLVLAASPLATMYAQTNPVPQQIPYTQTFDVLNGTAPALPAGWGGWRLEGQLGTLFTGSATNDATYAKGTNNSTAPAIMDMNGKLGFLSTNAQRISPVLSIKTLERKDVVVNYDINVQRINSNKELEVRLQYRIGQTGDFIDMPESSFVHLGEGAGTNTGNGVSSYVTAQRSITLPQELWYKDEVQLRWVTARTVNSVNSGDNHSFSIDNINITGNTPPDLPVAFPYTDNFDTSNWMLLGGTQVNKFHIGTPASTSTLNYEDNGKLFISNNGTAAGYAINSTSISYAYKNVTLPAGIQTAKLSFKWMARGESGVWDYGRFYIVPENAPLPVPGVEPTGRTTLEIPNAFYYAILQPGTGSTSSPFALYNAGNAYSGNFSAVAHKYEDNLVNVSQFAGQTVRLIYMWRNDSGGGNDPGLVVDDFKFEYTPNCLSPVLNATTNIEGRSAQLNWTSNGTDFEYYVSTTNTDPTETTTPTGTATGNNVTVTNLVPQTQYYAWVRTVCEGNEKSDWSSSVRFTTGVSCVAPTALVNTAVASNTATISWTSSAQGFKYYVSTTNTAPTATTEGVTVTQNNATVTGLNPGTTYYWWVKAICGTDDESVWSTSQTFSTSQANTAFPVVDNFNTATNWVTFSRSTATTPPAANLISKFVVNTPTSLTVGSGTTAGTLTFADGKLFITSDASNLSPVYSNYNLSYAYKDVTLPADLTVANLSFKWMFKGESTVDYGRFLIIPTTEPLNTGAVLGTNTTALNNIYSFNNNPFQTTTANKVLINHPNAGNSVFNGAYEAKANVYEDLSLDLTQYAGQTVRLLFYFRTDLSDIYNPSLIIDDFKFDYPAQCIAPTEVISANITARTADISWTASVSEPAEGYEYYLSTNASVPENTTAATGTVTGVTTSLTGLTPDTVYNVWVRSVCSSTTKSSWTNTTHTFRTLISCPAPTAPSVSDISADGATLAWTSEATNFEYYISTVNTAPTTDGIAVEGNTVTVSDLTSNTTYYWWVRANCGTEDGLSQWVAGNAFTTGQIPAAFPYIDNFETNQWALANGTELNKFYVGTPTVSGNVTFENNALFVSENGTAATYIGGTQSDVYAYRDITLPADLTLAKVTFKWVARGETGPYDYGRFFITTLDQNLVGGNEIGRTEATVPNAIYSAVNTSRDTYTYGFFKSDAYAEGTFNDLATTFVKEDIDLSAYAGQTVRVAFYWRNDTGAQHPPSLVVDDFEFTYAPSCLAPGNLSVDNLTDNSAVINWTGNADSYVYYYSTTNVLPENGVETSETTATLEGLQDNTTYYWWVKANCDDQATAIAGQPFTTFSTPKTYPFSDNFNGTNNWVLVNNNQTNKFVTGTPVDSELVFEDGALFVSNNNTSNTYTVTSTSASYAYVDVAVPTEAVPTELSFDWYTKGEIIGATIYDFGRVFVVPTTYTPTAGTNITTNGTITGQIYGSTPLQGSTGTGATFNEAKNQFTATVDLSAYAGQNVRIILYWRNDNTSGDQPPLAIDNFYFGPERDLGTHNLTNTHFDYYPNPVLNELNLRGENTISTIEVFNLAGQSVNQAKVGQKAFTLNTTKLTSGVYVVKVAFENGTTKTFKIIKK